MIGPLGLRLKDYKTMKDTWFGADVNVPPKHGRTEMWVITWYRKGDHTAEYFDDETAARETLRRWASCYPWNTYYLARVVDTAFATEQEQDPVANASGSGASGRMK